jgi:AraC-like DNA-binding protein
MDGVDLLSDVLALVRLTGALIFRLEIHGPWGIAACPTIEKFASLLPAGTNHVLSFHIVLQGECWIRLDAPDWMPVTAGEAVVIARGDPHDVADQPGRATVPLATMLHGQSVLDLRHASFNTGPGAATAVLCGFLGCDRRAFEPLFNSLPPMFKAGLGPQHRNLVQFALTETLDDRPGAACLRVRLAELLFMGALRAYMQTLPADATGWLAGLRDPLVGRALRTLHAQPCRRWTVDELATAIASSRSVLAERFRNIIGEPPMHYLTRLRMQLAARRLGDSRQSIACVADEVGYDSSAAFQRAFKRCFGVPPAAWRRHAAAGRQPARAASNV